MRTDVSDSASVQALADAVRDRFGTVHLLCNNAGVGGGGLIVDQTLADWQWVLGVNLWGVMHGLHSFLPMLAGELRRRPRREHGVGRRAARGRGHRAVQREQVGGRRDQRDAAQGARACPDAEVGVSVLCPGYVRTNIFESQRNRPEALRNPSRGRLATPAMQNDASQAVSSTSRWIPPRSQAMVHDAVIEDRFWMTTHPEFLKPMSERADDIVAGTNPRPGRFGE